MKKDLSFEYYIFVNCADTLVFNRKIIGPKLELVRAALEFFRYSEDYSCFIVFQKPELGKFISYFKVGEVNQFRADKILEKIFAEIDDPQSYYDSYNPFINWDE